MLRALRPLTRVRCSSSVITSASSSTLRALSTTPRRASDHGAPPSLLGEGSKAGEVPTDINQSTGLERLQHLGYMDGIDVFDMKPLDASRLGTLQEPILVPSLDTERIVGCTGSPADSHDVIWLGVNQRLKHHRCPECGSVYSLDFKGEHHDSHHH